MAMRLLCMSFVVDYWCLPWAATVLKNQPAVINRRRTYEAVLEVGSQRNARQPACNNTQIKKQRETDLETSRWAKMPGVEMLWIAICLYTEYQSNQFTKSH